MREECRNEKHIYRQTGAARHERRNEHRENSVFSAFDGAGRHDRRHIASETHQQRNKRLAVQADLVHEFVHNERYAGHITGVFHQGDEKEEDQNIRQKHNHAADAADDAVRQKIAESAIRHGLPEEIADQPDGCIYPPHRILSEREGGLEHHPEEEKEDGEAKQSVRQNFIDGNAEIPAVLFFLHIRLAECTRNESIFRIRDDSL